MQPTAAPLWFAASTLGARVLSEQGRDVPRCKVPLSLRRGYGGGVCTWPCIHPQRAGTRREQTHDRATPKTHDGEARASEPAVAPHELQQGGGGGTAPLHAQSSRSQTLHEIKNLREIGFILWLHKGGSKRGALSFPLARLCLGRAAAMSTVGEGPRTAASLPDVQSWQILPLLPFPGKHSSWTLLEEQDRTLENPFFSLISRVLSNK